MILLVIASLWVAGDSNPEPTESPFRGASLSVVVLSEGDSVQRYALLCTPVTDQTTDQETADGYSQATPSPSRSRP